jgi:hypothetical protein
VKTVMTLTWYRHFLRNGGLNQILKCQISRFHYGSKVLAVTITVCITILLEQNRQYIGPNEKDKRANNDLQRTIQKTKHRATRIPLTTESELRGYGSVSNSCSTSDAHKVHCKFLCTCIFVFE